MTFYGADTDALLAQARACQRGGERALDAMQRSESMVTAVQ